MTPGLRLPLKQVTDETSHDKTAPRVPVELAIKVCPAGQPVRFLGDAAARNGNEKHKLNPQFLNEDYMSNRVMVVIDHSKNAKLAMLWALSHVLYKSDTLILLHLLPTANPRSPEAKEALFAPRDPQEPRRRLDSKACGFANSLKELCQQQRPEGFEGKQRRDGGILHPECRVRGIVGEKAKRTRGRISDQQQKAEELLDASLGLCCAVEDRVCVFVSL
eukprot:Gb_02713 [translate_table: standard]